jgi:hypothetical protein
MRSRITTIAIASILLGACDAPTAPVTLQSSQASSAATRSEGQQNTGEQRDAEESCSFSRGTTTCVSTVQYTETTTHSEYSGCVAGPSGQPGSRVRTFSDTYLVTATTTTLRRGKSHKVYSSKTVTTRQLVSSTLVSDVCQPI